MRNYLDLLQDILDNGIETEDRTGVGTYSVFGRQIRFDLEKGFPLLTTKRVHLKSVIHELLWFLKGSTNIDYLVQNGVSIWNEWANQDGELGPIYGKQWRDFAGVDQIASLIQEIDSNPTSRRLIVTAWNPADLKDMALPPCHMTFQVKVLGGKLHLQMYQRSADAFLGVPFNIASYALLQHMLAQVTSYQVGELIISFGDLHIYRNHIDQVKLQLSRTPTELPKLRLFPLVRNINAFTYEDIRVEGYYPQPSISAPVAV